MSTAWILPGVIGPAIAAAVGQTLGWRAVFLGLLPLIGLAGGMTLGPLRAVVAAPAEADAEAHAGAADRSRLPLAILVSLGAGLVTVGLTTGQVVATAVLTLGGLAIGVYALRRLTPPGTLVARPGPAGRGPVAGRADLHVLRRRRVRRARPGRAGAAAR